VGPAVAVGGAVAAGWGLRWADPLVFPPPPPPHAVISSPRTAGTASHRAAFEVTDDGNADLLLERILPRADTSAYIGDEIMLGNSLHGRRAVVTGGSQRMERHRHLGEQRGTPPGQALTEQEWHGVMAVNLNGYFRSRATSSPIAEQNLSLALAFADRVYVLERGEVVHEGSAAEFREDRRLQKQYLGV
jgi:hypothetical protein